MRAYVIKEAGGVDALALIESPMPRPQAREVLIKLRAASLNPRDLFVLKAANFFRNFPLIPLSDGVGEVLATGDEVTRVKTGNRVAGIFMQKWLDGKITREATRSALGGMISGVLAEYIVLHEDGVVLVPDLLTDVEAASLPCSGVTAWNALVDTGQVAPGETVVVLGTGNVSLFAIQFASALKARVIVTSSSDEKLKLAQDLGAAETINYNRFPDWHQRVVELTDGVGCDHLLEIGGATTINQSINAVRIGGQIIAIGAASGLPAQVPGLPLVLNSLSIRGIYVGSRAMFEAMNQFIACHKIHPMVNRVFRFEEAPEAYLYMSGGGHFGKVCIAW
jgi:NADPH:quinone reductase-like Zn-dependent oxidoreductase